MARCLVDFITPVFDPATQTFKSKPGVEVEVKGFGQIVSLENLGPSLLPLDNFDYIRGFVKFMMTELHYTPGIDLFAAPYDWRYSPDVLKAQGYFTQLKALVESAYVSSGNRRVHLIGHSLVGREGGREGGRDRCSVMCVVSFSGSRRGCGVSPAQTHPQDVGRLLPTSTPPPKLQNQGGVVALAFLNDMELSWKRQYIKSYIPVGAPFGGTLMNLLGSVSGRCSSVAIKFIRRPRKTKHRSTPASVLTTYHHHHHHQNEHPPASTSHPSTAETTTKKIPGYNLGIPLNPADLRDFEAFSPTGPWLFPRPCLWGPDEVGGRAGSTAHHGV